MNNRNDDIKYSATDIQRYLDGKMTAPEMHAMEKAALEDPFLADALEGYALNTSTENAGDVADLHKRFAGKTGHPKVIPFHRGTWYKIAAAVIIIAGGMSVVYTMLHKNNERLLAASQKRNENMAVPGDTINTSVPLPLPNDTNSNTPAPADLADKAANAKQTGTLPYTLTHETSAKDHTIAKSEVAQEVAPSPKVPAVLSAPPETAKLEGRAAGITVEANRAKKNVNDENEDTEKKDTTELKEVVVTGYGNPKRRNVSGSVSMLRKDEIDTSSASPVDGMKAYREYLFNNRQIPAGTESIHGSVIINFGVKKSGRVHDFKVIKSLSPLLDEEVIRLIKKGPKWIPENKTGRATVTVIF